MYAQYGRVRALSLAQPFQTDYLVFITLRELPVQERLLLAQLLATVPLEFLVVE